MGPQRDNFWNQVEALFHGGLEIPAEERRAWLDSREAPAAVLREVEALFDGFDIQESRNRTESGPRSTVYDEVLPPARFGPYRLIRRIGQGGMGSVYLAHRDDGQFDQTVAVKTIASHLLGPEFLRRFHTERQLLASLDHPHIARLLDGGESSAGEPFLVMEYVDGLPLDRYCDDRRLNLSARLEIFLRVCGAVEYAHRNLIVHRDLKPANILVNGEGSAKLLDFGTAALLAGAISVTETRQRMLTPRYASPEQLRGERVNTSADVYSLGIVLYELLTGAWPFGDPESLVAELSRATGGAAAIPPSTIVTEDSAELRNVSREQLSRALKGDLSAIVLKAIESDPAHRYESVQMLGADVERYLEGRPVLAHPQTALYRAGKFLRKRWLAATATAVFIIGLSAAALIASYQANLARERYSDLRSLTTSLLFELKDAITDVPGATKAQQILVNRVVRNLDKMSQSSNDPNLQLELAEAFRQLGELQGDPYVQNLNDTAGALASLDKARSITAKAGSGRLKEDPAWLHLAGSIEQIAGEVFFGMGQAEQAENRLSMSCAYFEKMIPRTRNVAWLADAAGAYGSLADILGQPGTASHHDVKRAAAQYQRVIELDELTLKIDPGVVRSRRGIALMRAKLGDLVRASDPAAALDDFNEALRVFDTLPAEELKKPTTERIHWYLLRKKGVDLGDLEQWADAEAILRQVIAFDQTRALEDPNDSRAAFDLSVAWGDLLEQLIRRGDNARALEYSNRIVPALEALLHNDPANQVWRQNLSYERCLRGTVLARAGRAAEGLTSSRAGLEALVKMAAEPNAGPLVLTQTIEELRSIEPTQLRNISGSLAMALRYYSSGHDTDPYALYLVALAYRDAGKMPEAKAAAAKALALIAPPRGPLVWFVRRELETIR
jgi:serine/threonine protein kinase